MTLIIQPPSGGKLTLHQPQYPASPAAGEEWTDPSTGTVWVYDNGNWILSYNNWSFTIDTEAVTPGVTTFSIITNNPAACYCEIDWGDGQKQPLTIGTGVVTTTHTYATAGTYEISIRDTSGAFRPYYNNNAEAAKITALGPTWLGYSFGTALERAWFGGSNITAIAAGMDTSSVTNFLNSWRSCSSLTSFPLIDTSSGTNFGAAWLGCSSLTSFELINTSSGTDFSSAWNGCSSLTDFPLINTSSGTSFNAAWFGCSSLTSFPLINTSSVTSFLNSWNGCSSLTNFPLINTSSGINFINSWRSCSSLTSFPLIDTSSGTDFSSAWNGCSSLTDFPANFFDSWTGTPANNCFVNTWDGCTSLTATSVENILNSIDTSGQSAPASGVDITIDYDAGTGTPSVSTAVTNLKGRGWTITLNGVAQ